MFLGILAGVQTFVVGVPATEGFYVINWTVKAKRVLGSILTVVVTGSRQNCYRLQRILFYTDPMVEECL